MNGAYEQKNAVNELRLKSNDFKSIDIQPFEYGDFLKEMTYLDLICDDFPVYQMNDVMQVKPGRILEVPVYVSSLKGEGIVCDKSVKWRLVLYTKSGENIISNEGVMSAQYECGKVCKTGNIKFKVPDTDAVAIVEIYLVETQSEKIISRNFFMFDIFSPKANTLKTDLTDIGFSGYNEKHKILNDILYAPGAGKLGFEIKKSAVPGYEYGKRIHISLELCTYDDDDNINIYANNIRLAAFKNEDVKNKCGFLTSIYNCITDRDNQYECGKLFTINIPPFVLKGLPNTFVIKLESQRGIIIFGRKSGRYPICIETYV